MKITHNENIRNENVQDIFLRNATLSMLDLLNRQIVIQLKRGGKVEDHEVPFFYNFGGDEGFMKDFFLELPTDCYYPNHAEGNYEQLPRGIVTMSSFTVKPSDNTNKFVRGSFNEETRDENDQKTLKAFSARLFTLPMVLTFNVKIESDNINKTFKIMEKIFDFYYKNQVRYFQFRGVRIPAQITFPDTAQFTKSYSFVYSDANTVSISLDINMETYFPSFDDHSKMYKGNTIKQFNLRENTGDDRSTLNDSWIDQDYPPAE
ncbi:hypothetical protein UFOVP972_339 [uncultured Caudovirales phage]|jgi:hypothetical protein|uniref:Uncharacterized protein n=1 Tax=uncultured Caudovirales phage TaxID=2100421 RepID=A0A6J5PVA6_9CAUD|nr:hypothetical protein UFOVP972_339 [uncultured Caudovirales phage]